MKCFLHIGTEKTGTSTIQEFLHMNRHSLAKRNCLFMESAGRRNNRRLCAAAYDCSRRDDFTLKHRISTDRELRRYQQDTFQNIRSELAREESVKTTIFSSEHFQSRLTTTKEVQRLKDLLNQLGFSHISVIVYLRRPADIATSLYSTAIRGGALGDSPPAPCDRHFRNVCDHEGTLIRFGEVFGTSSLIPRLYDRNEWKNSCLLTDFLDCVGIPHAMESLMRPQLRNRSLSPLGIELLRRINRRIPRATEDDQLNPIRFGLVKFFRSYFEQGDKYILPAALHQEYETEFEEGNEWVRKMYFPEKQELFPPVSHPGQTPLGIEDQHLEEIADFISAMWIGKSEEITDLTRSRTYRCGMIWHRLKSRLGF